ncbi:MAG: hypothetical protein ABI696_10955 [Rubrivivax sp.]
MFVSVMHRSAPRASGTLTGLRQPRLRTCRLLAAAVCAGACLVGPAAADPIVAAGASALPESVLSDYERCHWAEAYAALRRLADQGHAEAARVALQMRRYGPALYGQAFEASPDEAQRWLRTAVAAATP